MGRNFVKECGARSRASGPGGEIRHILGPSYDCYLEMCIFLFEGAFFLGGRGRPSGSFPSQNVHFVNPVY